MNTFNLGGKMLKLKNDRIRSLLLESFLIILSVMLGLLGNDFRESMNKKETARYAMNNIVREINSNKLELKTSISKQDSLYSLLQKFVKAKNISEKKKSLYDIISEGGGIHFPTISTSAWETAVNTGDTENFKYDKLLQLTQIYEESRWIRSIRSRMLNMIYDKSIFDTAQTDVLAKTLMIPLADLISSEKGLVEAYSHYKT